MSRVPTDPEVRTVYLGRYTRPTANDIAAGLEDSRISWWYKEPGFFSQIWEFDTVRLFVDRDRLEDARKIAARAEAGDEGHDGD